MKAKQASGRNKKINENATKKSKLMRFSSAVSQFVPSPEETFSPNEFFKISNRSGGLQYLQPDTPEITEKDGSFQEAISSILRVPQLIAGLMPIKNLSSKNYKEMRKTKSPLLTIYTFLLAFSYIGMICLVIYWISNYRLEFGKVVYIVYYSTSLFTIICFYFLAKRWPIILEKFNYVEGKLAQLKIHCKQQKLAIKMRKISIIVLLFSMIQFLLLVFIRIYTVRNDCPGINDKLRAYFELRFPFVFATIPYENFFGFLFTGIYTVATFTWNYSDLFIILVSLGLSTRLKQFNECLMEDKGKFMMPSYWYEKRDLFLDLCNLVLYVDESITLITMIAMSKNLFFICSLLLDSFKEKESTIHAIYFWICLIHMIVRTLAIALYASDIHDETKKPVLVFRSIPRESWCHEIKRFIDDVINDTIALSGLKFFHISRGLVLNVAGTIITYELVLIQFHQTETITDYDPCQRFVNRTTSRH